MQLDTKPVRVSRTGTRSPAASAARRPSRRNRPPASIASYDAGSSSVSGTMPQLIRFARWIRANDLASTTRTPRYIGPIAATSREEP